MGLKKYIIKKIASDFSGFHSAFTQPNSEERVTENSNKSWRSSESGKDVRWPKNEIGDPGEEYKFESYSGTEIRTRTEQISAMFDANRNSLFQPFIDLINSLVTQFGTSLTNFPVLDDPTVEDKLFRTTPEGEIWKPFLAFNFPNDSPLPGLRGYESLNVPPHFLNHVARLNLFIAQIRQYFQNPSADPDRIIDIIVDFERTLQELTLINGISGSFTLGPVTVSANSQLPTAMRSSTNGSAGSVVQTGQEIQYSLNRTKQTGWDQNSSSSSLVDSEQKRIITRRELVSRDNERVRGAEVMWQDKVQDIITGTIPLNFTLPATATKMNFRSADDTLRVRFNSGLSSLIEVDFWFELIEETIKDDN